MCPSFRWRCVHGIFQLIIGACFMKKKPNLMLKNSIKKIQKSKLFTHVSMPTWAYVPNFSSLQWSLSWIWSSSKTLPLKHLDLHSWMSSAWSVVLRSCHIIFSYFFLTNYRTPWFYLRKNFNFSSFLHLVWFFSKRGQICSRGYSCVGVESSRNFDGFAM